MYKMCLNLLFVTEVWREGGLLIIKWWYEMTLCPCVWDRGNDAEISSLTLGGKYPWRMLVIMVLCPTYKATNCFFHLLSIVQCWLVSRSPKILGIILMDMVFHIRGSTSSMLSLIMEALNEKKSHVSIDTFRSICLFFALVFCIAWAAQSCIDHVVTLWRGLSENLTKLLPCLADLLLEQIDFQKYENFSLRFSALLVCANKHELCFDSLFAPWRNWLS